jgi:hypothetical protein
VVSAQGPEVPERRVVSVLAVLHQEAQVPAGRARAALVQVVAPAGRPGAGVTWSMALI